MTSRGRWRRRPRSSSTTGRKVGCNSSDGWCYQEHETQQAWEILLGVEPEKKGSEKGKLCQM